MTESSVKSILSKACVPAIAILNRHIVLIVYNKEGMSMMHEQQQQKEGQIIN